MISAKYWAYRAGEVIREIFAGWYLSFIECLTDVLNGP